MTVLAERPGTGHRPARNPRKLLSEADIFQRSPVSADYTIALRREVIEKFGDDRPYAAFAKEVKRRSPDGWRNQAKRFAEHFSDPKGPPWQTAELVLRYVVEPADADEKRRQFAGLYQQARGEPPPGTPALAESELTDIAIEPADAGTPTPLDRYIRAEAELRWKNHLLRDACHRAKAAENQARADANRWRKEVARLRSNVDAAEPVTGERAPDLARSPVTGPVNAGDPTAGSATGGEATTAAPPVAAPVPNHAFRSDTRRDVKRHRAPRIPLRDRLSADVLLRVIHAVCVLTAIAGAASMAILFAADAFGPALWLLVPSVFLAGVTGLTAARMRRPLRSVRPWWTRGPWGHGWRLLMNLRKDAVAYVVMAVTAAALLGAGAGFLFRPIGTWRPALPYSPPVPPPIPQAPGGLPEGRTAAELDPLLPDDLSGLTTGALYVLAAPIVLVVIACALEALAGLYTRRVLHRARRPRIRAGHEARSHQGGSEQADPTENSYPMWLLWARMS